MVRNEGSPAWPSNVVLPRQTIPVFVSPVKEKLPIAALYGLTVWSATAVLLIQVMLSDAWVWSSVRQMPLVEWVSRWLCHDVFSLIVALVLLYTMMPAPPF